MNVTEEKFYTCPMHQEVKQNHPGVCPKCGMALESTVVETTDNNDELDDMNKRFLSYLYLLLL